MSKRELNKYLDELTKKQLKEQVLDLYLRFKPVKTYYNFVFNPKEEKLLEDAKFKIKKEYFSVSTRKPKLRRSIAQKILKHYFQLGVDPYIIADVMLFNIEIAQKYTKEKMIKQVSFYTSMLKSYKEALAFIGEKEMDLDFSERVKNISGRCEAQEWPNSTDFADVLLAYPN